MPTFADAWNARPPPDIVLSPNPQTITVSGLYEEHASVVVDDYADQDMEDAEMWERETRVVVEGVRGVRRMWKAQERDTERERVWGEAMDIDYQLTPSGFHTPLLVLDTNILLSYLPSLMTLARTFTLAPAPIAEFIVPGIVVRELDYQSKRDDSLSLSARKATNWMLGELRSRKESGRGCVRVQKNGETKNGGVNWKTSHMINDDLILDCCLYFSGKTTQPVALLTDDKNLSLSAEAEDIPAIPGSRLRNVPRFLHDLAPALASDLARSAVASANSIDAKAQPSQWISPSVSVNSASHGSNQHQQYRPQQHDGWIIPPTASPPYPDSQYPHSTYHPQPQYTDHANHTRHLSDGMDMDMEPVSTSGPSGPPPGSLQPVAPPTPPTDQLTTTDQLKNLKSAFLSHIQPTLAQHTYNLYHETERRLQEEATREKVSLNSSIHARPPPRAARAQRSTNSLPLLPESPPETWTPRQSLTTLQHLPPPPPRTPTTTEKIDWSSLLAWTALSGEPGYRATGGSRGDWERAMRGMRVVGRVYGIEGWAGRDGDGEMGCVEVLEEEMGRILSGGLR